MAFNHHLKSIPLWRKWMAFLLLHSGGNSTVSQWTTQSKSDSFNTIELTSAVLVHYTPSLHPHPDLVDPLLTGLVLPGVVMLKTGRGKTLNLLHLRFFVTDRESKVQRKRNEAAETKQPWPWLVHYVLSGQIEKRNDNAALLWVLANIVQGLSLDSGVCVMCDREFSKDCLKHLPRPCGGRMI